MVLSVLLRAWRAGIVACGVAWFGLADSRAETPVLSASMELLARTAEPFGRASSSLTAGGLRDKWLGVRHRLDDAMVQLALCEGDRERCVSPAALKFLDIVDAAKLRDGRARLGEINRAINLATLFADLGAVRGCGFADLSGEPFDLVINATSAALTGGVPDVSPSIVMQLKVVLTCSSRSSCNAFASIAASVKMKHSIVAMSGAIMPAPLAMPLMVTRVLPICAERVASLG